MGTGAAGLDGQEEEQTPCTWPRLLSYARSLLVSTSTSGWAGGQRAGDSHLHPFDCFLATKTRRDGHLVPSQSRTSA